MYKERKKKSKKKFGNFPYISVIFSVSLSLLLLGIFSFFLLSSLQVKNLIEKNTEINPSPETLRIIQDKLLQKQFLRDNDIPVAEFSEIADKDELIQMIEPVES